MKLQIKFGRVLFLFAALACSLLTGSASAAQEQGRDLDGLAKRVSKEISNTGIKSVVVADFVGLDGCDSVEGHYLAEEFSQSLEHHKKNFEVNDKKQLSAALANSKISTKDLSSTDTLQQIGTTLHTDVIVTGTLETSPAQYLVQVTVRRVQDGSLINTSSQSVKRPAYVDTLTFLDPHGLAKGVANAGMDGVGVPTCVFCPSPEYTSKTRRAKIQGDVVLLVVVDQEGHPGNIVVKRSSDDELARKAIEAVRKWKFEPARNKHGEAVAVIVPIEVTFRLY